MPPPARRRPPGRPPADRRRDALPGWSPGCGTRSGTPRRCALRGRSPRRFPLPRTAGPGSAARPGRAAWCAGPCARRRDTAPPRSPAAHRGRAGWQRRRAGATACRAGCRSGRRAGSARHRRRRRVRRPAAAACIPRPGSAAPRAQRSPRPAPVRAPRRTRCRAPAKTASCRLPPIAAGPDQPRRAEPLTAAPPAGPPAASQRAASAPGSDARPVSTSITNACSSSPGGA